MGVSATEDGDDVLLRRFAAGDAEAFGAFYRRHLPAMLGFFLRRTGDRELTADLTAEVFAAALLAGERYRPGEGPPLAWLYGIAAHKLVDSRRRGRIEQTARRRLALEPLALEDEAIARIEELAARTGIERAVLIALESLPRAQRDAVLARVVEERDYREIAGELRCSEMVVRQRVSRGLRALRSEIDKAP
jgi:RNA polymerase sigma-70 factor (ECF subfamily)